MNREELIRLTNEYKTGEEYDTLVNHFSLDRKNLADKINHACDLIDPQKHSILFVTPAMTGTSAFRLWQPMLAMYRYTDELNLAYSENFEFWMLGAFDILIFHRAGDLFDQAHTVLKYWPTNKPKPIIIHNVDDNEAQLSKRHPMYQMWLTAGRDKQSIRSLRESDHVEITTHKLKQYVMNLNKNVVIERNQFNFKMPQWNLNKKRPITEFVEKQDSEKHYFPLEWNNKIVIGWSGLTSHMDDLKKMAPILKRIHDKYPDTVFVIAGVALKDSAYKITIDPKTGQQTMSEDEVPEDQKYRYRLEKLFSEFSKDRIKIYDALSLENYAWFNSLYDISLALVEHNTFNSCKCLVAGSLIATDQGIRKIETIIPEQNLKTDLGNNIIANIFYKEEQCVKLITESGYEIEGTISHRIKNINNEWENFDSINIGDTIQISPFEIKQKEYQYFKFPMLINKYENVNIEDGIELNESIFDLDSLPSIKLTEKWAELLGLFVGDGHLRQGGNFSICCDNQDQDLVLHIQNLLISLGLKAKNTVDARTKGGGRNCTYVNFNSKSLMRILFKYGFLKKVDYQKPLIKTLEIPDCILQSPKSVIASFLKGLFEADGTVSDKTKSVSFCSKSKQLAQTVHYLLLGFGIKSNLRERYNTDGKTNVKHISYTVSLAKKSTELFKQIGFISKRKQTRLNKEFKSLRFKKDRLKNWDWSEKIVGKIYTYNDVYDIEVENTHEYNSNGFISHNSEIKVVEACKYKSIPIFSNFAGYADFVNILQENKVLDNATINKMACQTESDISEWASKIEYWIENYNSEEYKNVTETLSDFVTDYYDIDKNISARVAKYKRMIEQNIESEQNRILNAGFQPNYQTV